MPERAWRRWLPALGLALGLLMPGSPAVAGRGDERPPVERPLPPAASVFASMRGINVNEGLDTVRNWRNWPSREFLQSVRDAGFNTVRVPMKLRPHLSEAGRIDPAYVARVLEVTQQALGLGLYVILDLHDQQVAREGAAAADLIHGVFTQLDAALRAVEALPQSRVAFELLNEPQDAPDADDWNATQRQALQRLRASGVKRTLVVTGWRWSEPASVTALDLPADDNLVVTVHYYSPMEFTHQGAPWLPKLKDLSGVQWRAGTRSDSIERDFRPVRDWMARHRGVPVFLGEFGARETADAESRWDWMAAVASAGAAWQIGWILWSAVGDFALYDAQRRCWDPQLQARLLPEGRAVACPR